MKRCKIEIVVAVLAVCALMAHAADPDYTWREKVRAFFTGPTESAGGKVVIRDAGTNTVTIQAPASLGADYTGVTGTITPATLTIVGGVIVDYTE